MKYCAYICNTKIKHSIPINMKTKHEKRMPKFKNEKWYRKRNWDTGDYQAIEKYKADGKRKLRAENKIIIHKLPINENE